MPLGADPEGMPGQLDELHETAVGRGSRANEPGFLEAGSQTGIDLVTVAVSLGDDGGPVASATWEPGTSWAT